MTLGMSQLNAELIGSTEACEILRVSRATITRWVSDGSLPTVGKLPGKNGALLFLRPVVEAKRLELSPQAAVDPSPAPSDPHAVASEGAPAATETAA